MDTKTSTHSIGSFPTAEIPICAELVVLDLLDRKFGKPELAFASSAALAVEMLQALDRYPAPDAINDPCSQPNPPRWCWYATELALDFRNHVIESLSDNALIEKHEAAAWKAAARTSTLFDLAPGILRSMMGRSDQLDAARSLDVLDAAMHAGSRVRLDVPNSPWAETCRKRPSAPLCTLITAELRQPLTREWARDLGLLLQLSEIHLLDHKQARTAIDYLTRAASARMAAMDRASSFTAQRPLSNGGEHHATPMFGERVRDIVSTVAGVVVTDGYVGRPAAVAKIRAELRDSMMYASVPDVCLRTNPPKWCLAVSTIPRTTTLLKTLVDLEVLDASSMDHAIHRLMGGLRETM